MTIQELLNQKKDKIQAATEIRERVYNEQAGEWRGDDTAKFDGLMSEADGISEQVDRLAKLEAAERSLDDTGQGAGRQTRAADPGGRQQGDRSPVRHHAAVTEAESQEAMRSWLLAGSDVQRTDEMRALASRAGFNLDQRNFSMKLPRKALRSATPSGVAEWRAQGVVSGSYGGYTVPDETMRALEEALLAHGGMRSVATILRTDSGASLPIPTMNDTSNKGAILAENSQTSEQVLTFNQLVLDSYKYTSKHILVSVELLQDSAINVAEFIGKALGTRIARITNDHFTTGSGNGQPNGIVTAAADSNVTGTATAFTYDNMVSLVHSVDPAYRGNAQFMFSDATLAMLKKIKVLQYSGDTVGAPLWSPGLAMGQPDTILGYRYVINQSMASGTSEKSIIFGDFSKYLIRDVRDVTLLRLDERFADYHQVAFLAFSRHDGDLLDAGTNPVKYADHA